jgi:c-di-GMP-binding flagellar brake protein YcgR
MNGEHQVERRRGPRWTVRQPVNCTVQVRTRVRLVDISASGMLLAGDVTAPVGAAGRLRAGVGPGFASAVEVRRHGTVPQRSAPAVGVKFTDMDDRSRQSLEASLKKANA